MVVRLAGLFFFALAGFAQAKPLLVDDAQISKLSANKKLSSSLIKKCDTQMGQPAHAIADFAPKPRYTATGVNPEDDRATGLTKDFRRAYLMALCYRLTGDAGYAKHTQTIADAWAATMKSASSAQGRGSMNFNSAQLVVAASWVEDANGWNAAPFKSWLKTVIVPLSLSGEPNNRGNWGVLQDASIAAFTGDKEDLQKSADRWRALVSSQIAADGTLPAEICRSNTSNHCGGPDKGVNGMAYTHFALLPMVLSGTLLEDKGFVTFLHPTVKEKLSSAYVTTIEYVLRPETFPYFKGNGGKLNKIDYCSYLPLLRKYFEAVPPGAMHPLREGYCRGDYWLLKTIFSEN